MKPSITRSTLTVLSVAALIMGSSSAGFAVETNDAAGLSPVEANSQPVTSEPTAAEPSTPAPAEAAETVEAQPEATTGAPAENAAENTVEKPADAPAENPSAGATAFRSATPAAETTATENNGETAAANNATPETVTVTQGYANWDFRRSFREYVGFENETLSGGLSILNKGNHLLWKPAAGQTLNTKQPTGKLAFSGQVGWVKYDGVLNVKISNPTIDFDNKVLLIDGYTAGTMARAGVVEFRQEAIATLSDLQVQAHEGYLVISSLNPVFTDRVKDLVGLYTGEKAAPLVVTVATKTSEDFDLPQPVLWELFPENFKNPVNEPIYTDAPLINVEIADKGLDKCIRNQYDVAEGIPITNKLLESMQALKCAAYGIKSLSGLEHAVNLTSVNFYRNQLFTLSPLKNATKLVDVHVGGNKLTNLNGLENATQLHSLKANNNQLTDVSVIKRLGYLSSIDLSNNRLSDLSQLAVKLLDESDDKLQTLNLSNNRISDLSAINTLPIVRNLDLSHNQITEIGTLAEKPGLLKLNLEHNFITDPSALGAWADQPERRAFEQLRIRFNAFEDWSSLRPLTEAENLYYDEVNKVYSFPRSGEEADVVNPKTLDEVRAKQAEADAAFAPELQAYEEAEAAKRAEEEAKKNFTATLSWGVRESFRTYVSGDFAHGKWTVADGVSGTFDFPLLADAKIKPSSHDVLNFGGKVHFSAHDGMLDLTIANLSVKKVGAGWKLYGDVLSRPFDKSQVPAYMAARFNPNAPKPKLPELVETKQVELADLGELRESTANGAKVLYFGAVALTEAGGKAFAGFYPTGTEMDVLTVNIHEGIPTGVVSTLDKTSAVEEAPALAAQLDWGVKESFRNYIKGPVAHGDWTLTGGVSGEFLFPGKDGVPVAKDATKFQFSGTVHFKGHDGLLNLAISAPVVEKVNGQWQLVATVTSVPLPANTPGLPANGLRAASGLPAGGLRAAQGAPVTVRTAIANLSAPTITETDGVVTLKFASVTLTQAGSEAFAKFYPVGQVMDALAINVAPKAKLQPGLTNLNLPGTTQPANPGSTNTGATNPGALTPGSAQSGKANTPAPAVAKPAGQVKPKQCQVDPTKQRITGGSLAWGVRASFNNYIRGSIAHGGWDLNGISWDGANFNWPATGGVYNTATKSGTIYYGGSVHYHGHDGILDLTLANPTLVINGNSGALYLSVTGSDMQGKKFNLGRVHFANVGFGGAYVANGQLQLSNASVSLTAAGAQAFVGFYKAGEALAPLGSTVNLVNATACDPATGELIEYGAFGNALPATGSQAQALLLLSMLAAFGGCMAVMARRKLK